jgi:hypothetical protein
MKRTIEFVGKTVRGYKTHNITIKLSKAHTTKLRETMVKTDIGYVDLTVSLDRWGRLNAVEVTRSRVEGMLL